MTKQESKLVEGYGKKKLKFMGKALVFCLPIFLILGFPLLVLYRSGELLSYEALAARQLLTEPVLIGMAYSNPSYYMDLNAAVVKKPEVLVVGSSRVEEIRSTFFKKGATTYTASQIIQQMGQFRQFLQNIPSGGNPRVLMLGLDQKFFDPSYDASAFGVEDIGSLLTQPKLPITDVLSNWWAKWYLIYYYILRGQYPLADIFHTDNFLVGLTAIVHRLGLRNDGSWNQGDSGQSDGTWLSAIDDGVEGFEYSQEISTSSLNELDRLLAECYANKIHVVGFTPPFSPTIYNKIMSMPQNYGYLSLLAPGVKPLFDKYGFTYYDFTDPQSLGATDKDIPDGIHTTERGALMMFLAMAKTDPVLGQYADTDFLEARLASTTQAENLF
jgi:hypothetical protein